VVPAPVVQVPVVLAREAREEVLVAVLAVAAVAPAGEIIK